jgi:flagellar motor switch protein FliN/FliY
VSDVPVTLTVEIGSSRMLLREVLQLDAGSVVELDRESGELADVLVNGRLVARGDVTVVDERLAVRIVEVVRGR